MKKKRILTLIMASLLVGVAILYASNGVGFGKGSLSSEQKAKINTLFTKSGIVAVGKVVDMAPEGAEFIHPAVIIDEIFKLKTDVVNSPNELIGKPIFIQRQLMQKPDYSSKRKNMGKHFLIYGYVDEIPKDHPYSKITKNNLRISTSSETIIATQDDIERIAGDTVFLGRIGKADEVLEEDTKYRTMQLEVVKAIKGNVIEKIVARFPYDYYKNDNSLYSLDVSLLSDPEKLYWFSASRIKGTEHFNAIVIGADSAKELAFLRKQ